MFDRLLKSLFTAAPAPLQETDARLALTALLVRIARSDGEYAAAEIAKIRDLAAARYGLEGAEVEVLLKDAEAFEAEAPDTVKFTEAIKAAVPFEDRLSVIEAAWAVVLADGARADEEDSLMRMIARFLGVNDRDSHLARLRAQAE